MAIAFDDIFVISSFTKILFNQTLMKKSMFSESPQNVLISIFFDADS